MLALVCIGNENKLVFVMTGKMVCHDLSGRLQQAQIYLRCVRERVKPRHSS
jgi:hypothetical protein